MYLHGTCKGNKAELLVKFRLSLCLLLLLKLVTLTVDGNEGLTVEILEEEFSIDRYSAPGNQLILYIATGHEMSERINKVAAGIAELGIEFWHVDLLENLFLFRLF